MHAEKLVQEAIELGDNRKRLKTRLQGAVGALDRKLAPMFKNATFDFENKRLVSNCGRFYLQWSAVAKDPAFQTRDGNVSFVRV